MSRRDGRDEYYPERRPAPRDAPRERDRDDRGYGKEDRGYGREDRGYDRPRDPRDAPRDRDYDRPDRPRDPRDAYDRSDRSDRPDRSDRRDPRDRDYDRSDRPPRDRDPRDRDYEDRPREPRDPRDAPRDRDYGDRRDPDRRERDYTLPKSVRFGASAAAGSAPPTRESFLASLRGGASTQSAQPAQPGQAGQPSSGTAEASGQTEPKQGETNGPSGEAQNGNANGSGQPGRYAYTRLPDMRKQAIDMVRAYLEQKDWSLVIGAMTPELQEEYLSIQPNTPHAMNMIQVALREIWKWDRRYKRRPRDGKDGVPNPNYGKDITEDYAEVLLLIDVACPELWKDEKYAPFEPKKGPNGVENPRYDFMQYVLALMSQVAAALIKRTFTPMSDRQTRVADGVTLKYVANKSGKGGASGIGISTSVTVSENDLTSPPPIDKQSKVYMAQLSKNERRMYMEMNNLRGRGARGARYDDDDEEYEGD